ncbi:sulfatase, partial [Clostridium botulinum]
MINIKKLKELKKEAERLIELGELEEAILIINKYEKKYSYDLDIYTIKATIFFYKKQYEIAEKILLDIYYKYEYNFEVNYNLGIIYYYKNEYLKALEYFYKLIMLDEERANCLQNLISNALRNVSKEDNY